MSLNATPMKLSVEYDLVSAEDRTIYVPVRVSPPTLGSGDPLVWTPPLALPKGTWKVIWQLDPESLQLAKFIFPGIEKHDPNSVPQLIVENNWIGTDHDHCAVTLTNQTNEVEEPASCSMDFYLEKPQGGTFTHDPTIAVTKDPLDPPTHPPRKR
jgi:hypothetical protein